MKNKLIGIVAFGLLAASTVTNATPVTSGYVDIVRGFPYPRISALLGGEGFEFAVSGQGECTIGVAKDTIVLAGDTVRLNPCLSDTGFDGIDVQTTEARGSRLNVNSSPLLFQSGQLTYTGSFDFSASICIPLDVRVGSTRIQNCDLLDFPALEGHGSYEATFRESGELNGNPLYVFVGARYTFVPEPTTLGLLGLGLAGLGFARKRKAVAA
jgi:hypothetical protein